MYLCALCDAILILVLHNNYASFRLCPLQTTVPCACSSILAFFTLCSAACVIQHLRLRWLCFVISNPQRPCQQLKKWHLLIYFVTQLASSAIVCKVQANRLQKRKPKDLVRIFSIRCPSVCDFQRFVYPGVYWSPVFINYNEPRSTPFPN